MACAFIYLVPGQIVVLNSWLMKALAPSDLIEMFSLGLKG